MGFAYREFQLTVVLFLQAASAEAEAFRDVLVAGAVGEAAKEPDADQDRLGVGPGGDEFEKKFLIVAQHGSSEVQVKLCAFHLGFFQNVGAIH